MADENMVLSIAFDDDTEQNFELLSIFDADNGERYAAMFPYDRKEGEIPPVSLFRVKPKLTADGEDYDVFSIASNEEFNIALEAFERQTYVIPDPSNDSEIEEEIPIITLNDDNGHSHDWQFIDTFTTNGREYIALMPIDSNDETGNDGQINIHLFRMARTSQGGRLEGIEVNNIPSDMEYEAALAVFEKRVSASNEEP